MRFKLVGCALNLAAMIGVWMGVTSAYAALVRPIDLTELCDYADTIVIGSILAAGHAHELDTGRVVTDFPVAVVEPIKGNATFGEVLSIRQSGGQLPDKVVRVPRTVVVSPGDLVVLFLRKTEDRFALVGADRGIWRVDLAENEPVLMPYRTDTNRTVNGGMPDPTTRHSVGLPWIRQWVKRSPGPRLAPGHLTMDGRAAQKALLRSPDVLKDP